jgi:hypothetical protein
VVGLYLAASASEPPAGGKKPSAVRTIERRLSAIAWNCAQHGQPLDRADRHIAEVMSGIRRRHARPPDQKEAVLAEDLLRMAATLAHGLRGLRDRAILLIGFAGGLRRSERRRGCNNKASCGQRARSAAEQPVCGFDHHEPRPVEADDVYILPFTVRAHSFGA